MMEMELQMRGTLIAWPGKTALMKLIMMATVSLMTMTRIVEEIMAEAILVYHLSIHRVSQMQVPHVERIRALYIVHVNQTQVPHVERSRVHLATQILIRLVTNLE